MAWVDSEYAGELAVVSAWIATLLPWSVSLRTGLLNGVETSLLTVRFPFVMIRYLTQNISNFTSVITVWNAPSFQVADASRTAYYIWLAGGIVIAIALAFSFLYYAREAQIEAELPVSPVRVMGGLLTVGGGLLLVSALWLIVSQAYLTVPIGAIIVPLLGVLLLRADLDHTSVASPGDVK